MACELRLLSSIDDIEKCHCYLFGDQNNNPRWLQDCIVAVSPFSDRIVLAHGSALVILISQWDRAQNASTCRVARQWDAQDNQINGDLITCAIILPLVGVGNYSQSAPDWFCIAVGFSSGHVRFFTDNLDVLAVVHLHSDRVLHIKATGNRKRSDTKTEAADLPEALFVVYPTVICNIPGFSLFQTLRSSRQEVALKRARDDCTSPSVSLDYKKFGFPEPVRDACVVGAANVNNFDHLLAATISDGFYKNYRPSPPQQTLFVSTGPSSWCRFDHSTEGVAPPLELSEVALTVINKLPGWLGLSSSKPSAPPPKPTEKLTPWCKLLDRRREGKCLVCSPDGSHVVIIDALGRVTLVETGSGMAVRLWKGYRDAECGFLEVEEEVPKPRHRHKHETSKTVKKPGKVLLLAIYVPKKGLIELFPLRYGTRVAALRVSKNGRLIYSPHGLLGGTTSSKKASGCVHLVFVSEDGLLDLLVPFHSVLVDSSARSKDLHVLKQLKLVMKEAVSSEDSLDTQVTKTLKLLETDEVRLMALDLLLTFNNVTPDIINSASEIFLQVAKDTDIAKPGGGQRSLIAVCKQLRAVVKFFSSVKSFPSKSAHTQPEQNTPLSDTLHLSEPEVTVLLERVNNCLSPKSKKDGRVKFQEASQATLSKLLQCFDFTDTGPVSPSPKLKEDDYRNIGEQFFGRVSSAPEYIDQWTSEARLSNINASLLARSLITYWLHRPQGDSNDWQVLVRLLVAVSSLSDEPVTSPDYNTESFWWTELRGVIAQSRNTIVAMTTAVCCRAASIVCEQQSELMACHNSKERNSDRDWETVSADTWQWDLLISQLQDMMIVNLVVGSAPEARTLDGCDVCEVSLAELRTAGAGAVSELAGKWISQFDVSPGLFIDKSDVEFRTTPTEPIEPSKGRNIFKGTEKLAFPLVEVGESANPENAVVDKIQLLKKSFPMSLTSSVILSHVGWELMSRWQQELSNTDLMTKAVDYFLSIPSAHLKAGISSLAWSTYILVHFEGITRLVSKMGRLPTETLCVREIGMSRSNIAVLLQNAGRLLLGILDACSERPLVPFTRRIDDLWVDSPGTGDLVHVAVSRPAPCEDVVLIHHQMTTVLHMVAALEIKDKAVLSALFDSLKCDLFGELTTRRNIAMHHPGLSDSLLTFLRRAVSAAIQTIHEVEGDDGTMRVEAGGAYNWIRVCSDLASAWRLPLDSLKRQQVCELYSSGYDRLAEEALPSVSNSALLASQLLVVVGKRIKSVMVTSTAPQHVIADLSPALTSWINSLGEDDLRDHRSTLEDAAILINYILLYLPTTHMDAEIASRMEVCIQGLIMQQAEDGADSQLKLP